MERCSILLAIRGIREMQIEITVKYYFTLTRMAIIKKDRQHQVLVTMWRDWNPHALLVGM